MKQFNILDRHQSVLNNCLLEASAGTGKTFSIENIVVRLLLEEKEGHFPLTIEQILVVTFTRAAARELRRRVRTTIEQALYQLKTPFEDKKIDYLSHYIEEGEESRKNALKHLENALFTFDQAQIFTIHSFCSKMLTQFPLDADMGFNALASENAVPIEKLREIIDDYFRTELRQEEISLAQLKILFNGDPDQKKLLKAIQAGNNWLSIPSFQEQFHIFCDKMQKLGRHDPALLLEDFEKQAPCYKNYKIGETKAETLEKIKAFVKTFEAETPSVKDFEVWIRDGLIWPKVLADSLLKAKAPPQELLNYPFFKNRLEELSFFIEEVSDFSFLLARAASGCRKLLERCSKEEERFSPDDLLQKMAESIRYPAFFKHVQSQYRAVIIDEFQDTDPLQWKIFDSLFLSCHPSWKGFIYLVGDPKQSIYSFRQADIYTYLKAAKTFSENERFSLETNYRSKPCLIEALNTLFDEKHVSKWIVLPKKLDHIPYRYVKSPKEELNDDSFLHFFIADLKEEPKTPFQTIETEIFFPFIAENILKINKEKNLPFSDFAILVKDRFQALRLTTYLNQASIPSINQRGTYLADSPILQGFIDFMRAIVSPREHSALNSALGSVLIGWSFEDFHANLPREKLLPKVHELGYLLSKKGFSVFFDQFLQTSFSLQGDSIATTLLKREEGTLLYRDLLQIGDYLIAHEGKEWRGLNEIVPFLDAFYEFEKNDEGKRMRLQDPNTNSVKILTLHYSKGLEFEVVFALGLVNKTPVKKDWFPLQNEENSFRLTPSIFCKKGYLSYIEECDAEKMRQLYVALTRAKRFLFVPVAIGLKIDSLSEGEASPIDLFFGHMGTKTYNYSLLYEALRERDSSEQLLAFLEKSKEKKGIHFSRHTKILPILRFDEEKKEQLIRPEKVEVLAKPIGVASFSSLNREHATLHDEEFIQVPSDYASLVKTIHTLPGNSATGLLFHQLLEDIDFRIKKEELFSFALPYLANTPYEGWEKPIVSILEKALSVNLKTNHGIFSLNQLDRNSLYREMPFLFNFDFKEAIPEITFHDGMIKGVIDLFFYHQGRYYLLDWKTNWLGNGNDSYERSKMEESMKNSGYFLQAAIYKEAIKRYLKVVDPRPFEECFGGILYIYLRGLEAYPVNGIYYFS